MELIVTGLKKVFDSKDGEPPFELDIPQLSLLTSRITYIVGHNGSGKSVFLKLLAGEIKPSGSAVQIRIGETTCPPHELPVSVVRQKAEDNLCGDLSVEENLLLRLPAITVQEKLFPKKYLQMQIIGALDGQDELARKLKQVCSQLSGGQRQALAYFTAAAQAARILCLDEFLSSIDHSTSLALRNKTRRYAVERDACVLIVSHDLDVALADADRIIVFRKGRIVNDTSKSSTDWNRAALLEMVSRI
jgi:ABC-type uncharacterized transport system ATPase component